MEKDKIYYGTIIDSKVGIIALNSHVNLYPLSSELKGKITRDIYIICGIWWTIEGFKQSAKILFIAFRNKLLFPNIKVIFLCNTLREKRILKSFGIKAIFCNQNCFVDENIFNIRNGVEKKYNSVYNGVLKNFKRHFLCRFLKNLALVTYNFSNVNYKNEVDSVLDNPNWLNYKNGTTVFLNNDELCNIYNESKVGLALSAVEGAMYASTEYMLSGLPVVSTPSKGGRDIFFTNNNSVIVDPTPESVSAGVNLLLSNPTDPNEIRNEILAMMKEHRTRFFNCVNDLLAKKGYDYDIESTWERWFVNKLRKELTAKICIQEIEG